MLELLNQLDGFDALSDVKVRPGCPRRLSLDVPARPGSRLHVSGSPNRRRERL